MPKGFPFFAVSFGTDGGFAHVIEDEQLFQRDFGLVSCLKLSFFFLTGSALAVTQHTLLGVTLFISKPFLGDALF